MPFAMRSDESIVKRVRRGDVEAFGHLVRRYQKAVYGVCFAHVRSHADAEDRMQDAFVKAFVRLDTLREPRKFAPWLLAIARNTSRASLTRRSPEVPLSQVSAQVEAVQGLSNTEILDVETQDIMRSELERLSPKHREVLSLHYFAGRSTRETAALLGISRAAVKKRLQRAREDLGRRLVNVFEEDASRNRLGEEQTQRVMSAVVATTAPWLGKQAVQATPWLLALLRGVLSSVGGNPMKTLLAGMLVAGMGVIASLSGSPSPSSEALEPSQTAAEKAGGESVADGAATATAALADSTGARADTESPGETLVAEAEMDASFAVAVTRSTALGAERAERNPYISEVIDLPERTGPGVIGGYVVRDDGTTVPNARIELTARAWDLYLLPNKDVLTHSVHTDADGCFWAENLPLVPHLARVYAGGHGEEITFNLRPDEPYFYETLEIFPLGAIAGKVTGADGAPIDGAMVRPYYAEGEDRIWRLDWSTLYGELTDEEGRFEIDHLYTNGRWKILAAAPGYCSTVTSLVPIGTSDLSISLTSGACVEGTVTYADSGRPLAGVTVEVLGQEPRRDRFLAVTNEGGWFSVDGLREEDNYEVCARIESPLVQNGIVGIRHPAKGETIPVSVEVSNGGVIAGHVFEQETVSALPDVRVEAQLIRETPFMLHARDVFETQTDRGGSFAFHGLPRGQYHLRCSIPEYQRLSSTMFTEAAGVSTTGRHRYLPGVDGNPAEVRVGLADGQTVNEDITVSMDEVWTLPGVVLNAAGQPMVSAVVSAQSARAQAAATVSSFWKSDADANARALALARTDTGGRFCLMIPSNVERIYVQATLKDLSSDVLGPISMTDSSLTEAGIVLSEPQAAIAGNVVDSEGNPVYAATVCVEPQGPWLGPLPQDVTGRTGYFEVRVQPGQHTLHLGPSGKKEGHRHRPALDTATVIVSEGEFASGLHVVYEGAVNWPWDEDSTAARGATP